MEKRNLAVLVIDDDPADVEILQALLEQIEGWKIEVLARNEAGIGPAETLRRQANLIFLDCTRQGENRFEPSPEIPKEGSALPVIMFTGHDAEAGAGEAMETGVSASRVKGRITPDSVRWVIADAVRNHRKQQKVEKRRRAVLEAERTRVMMESVAATCHHFAGPLTTMMANLEMFTEAEDLAEPEKKKMLAQCRNAAAAMKMILNKFQQVREYRTRPFLEDFKILDIGLGSIYGTPEFQDSSDAGEA